MERFTTRVELHDASSDEYGILYEEMKNQGFVKTIAQTSTGRQFHLPEAEYNIMGDYTKKQVLDKAIEAANVTGCESSILVTHGDRLWHNLSRVRR